MNESGASAKGFPHSPHWWSRSPWWPFWCWTRLDLWLRFSTFFVPIRFFSSVDFPVGLQAVASGKVFHIHGIHWAFSVWTFGAEWDSTFGWGFSTFAALIKPFSSEDSVGPQQVCLPIPSWGFLPSPSSDAFPHCERQSVTVITVVCVLITVSDRLMEKSMLAKSSFLIPLEKKDSPDTQVLQLFIIKAVSTEVLMGISLLCCPWYC